MKKFLAALLVAWTFATSVAFAVGYPRFWKGDTNYPFVWGHQGTAWYLDKNSVKIKRIDSPYYIITAEIISVSHSDYSPDEEKYSNDKEASSKHHLEFFYDEDEPDMRIYYGSKVNWGYLRPQGSNAESGIWMYVGEAVFYVATGKKFYGNYLWKSEYKDAQGNNEYRDIFKDEIYKDLR